MFAWVRVASLRLPPRAGFSQARGCAPAAPRPAPTRLRLTGRTADGRRLRGRAAAARLRRGRVAGQSPHGRRGLLMKFEIKHRWTGKLLFECEADSIKLAVELAIEKE